MANIEQGTYSCDIYVHVYVRVHVLSDCAVEHTGYSTGAKRKEESIG